MCAECVALNHDSPAKARKALVSGLFGLKTSVSIDFAGGRPL